MLYEDVDVGVFDQTLYPIYRIDKSQDRESFPFTPLCSSIIWETSL